MNPNITTQDANSNWIFPKIPFYTVPSYLSPCLPVSPQTQPLTIKRFAAENEEDKDQAVLKPIPIVAPMKLESEPKKRRKNYFNITKGEVAKDKKTLRAEKNRLFAKESRDRKQMYIRDIENQVRILKLQVEEYKQRLSKYELIETNLEFGCEIKKYLEAVSDTVAETKDALNTNEAFFAALKKFYEERTKDKQRALGVLTKAMVEMLIPFSVKLVLWAKNKGLDLNNTLELQKLVHENAPYENIKNVEEYIKCLKIDKVKPGDDAECLVASGTKLRNFIRKVAKCQKKAQIELAKVCNYMCKNVFPSLDMNLTGNFLRITAQLALNPELSNYALCQLTDSDFVFSEENENKGEAV